MHYVNSFYPAHATTSIPWCVPIRKKKIENTASDYKLMQYISVNYPQILKVDMHIWVCSFEYNPVNSNKFKYVQVNSS